MIIPISTRYSLLWSHVCWNMGDRHPQCQLCSLTTSGWSSISCSEGYVCLVLSTFFFQHTLFPSWYFCKSQAVICIKGIYSNRKVSQQWFLHLDSASGCNLQVGLKDDLESSLLDREGVNGVVMSGAARCIFRPLSWKSQRKGTCYSWFFANTLPYSCKCLSHLLFLFCRKETEALRNHVLCLRHHSKALSKNGWKYKSVGACCLTSTFDDGKTRLLHDLRAEFRRNSVMFKTAETRTLRVKSLG